MTERLTVSIFIMDRGSSFIPLLGIYFTTGAFKSGTSEGQKKKKKPHKTAQGGMQA